MVEGRSPIERFFNTFVYMLDRPTTLFREHIVEPNQQKYPWYHQKFRRVPTVDECYMDDLPCTFEANQQFKREKLRDDEILSILRQRYEDCRIYEGSVYEEKCMPLYEAYRQASAAWFSRYGDLGVYGDAKDSFMKQKHRMVWERRHGPIGSGMKKTTLLESE